MNPLINNGQLNSDIFLDENAQPIQLLFDEQNHYWHGNQPTIQFGQQILTDAEFHFEKNSTLITANALVGGISLTFEYDAASNRFESDEKINIIHIVADQIHTLTDFTIHHSGEISTVLKNEMLCDLAGNVITLIYDEKTDTWISNKLDGIKYGLCRFEKSILYLNDYDLFVKGVPPFSDNVIEFYFGKSDHDEIYFHASNVKLNIGTYEFRKADIRYFVSGQLEACGQLSLFERWVDFSYANGKMHGKVEITKKYFIPDKGCFEKKPYYQLNILNEADIDIFNSRQLSIQTTYKVTNPFVAKGFNKGPVAVSIKLNYDPVDSKFKAIVPQQTAIYKGLAKNGFLGEYQYEESKQYIYDPDSEILTVGTKFLEGHGKLFYKKVFNYYYKNFEQYSVVKGIWPFRRIEYQFYYQMLSQANEC